MGLSVEVGTKLSPGATGVQTYALPAGFGVPKAVIVWASNQAATGTQTAAGMFGMGFGTDRGGTPQTAYASWLVDPSNTASRIVNFSEAGTTLLKMPLTLDSATADWIITLDSFSTDAWAINWTDLPTTANTFLHYIVLGGSDISDAHCGSFQSANPAVSPQSVALPAGFGQPDLVGFLAPSTLLASTAPSGALTRDLALGLGWAVSDTERAALVMGDNDAATTMAASSWAKARAAVMVADGVTAEYEMELDARGSWPTDGFQVTWPDLPAALYINFYLALKGTFQKKILESRTTATATGDQDHDVGFAPKLAINWGHVMPSAQTVQRAAQNADATMFWHGATDGTNQAVAGVSQDDGKATSFGRSYAQTAQTLHAAEAVAAATRAQATGSFNGNNVRLTYGTAHATARQFHLLALGDAAGGGAPETIPILVTARTRP
jgi:hypothetical protein